MILCGYSCAITWHAGDGKGGFKKTQILKTSEGQETFGGEQCVGLHAEFWDWDGDGDLDLLTSNIMEPGLNLHLNEGTPEHPVFSSEGTKIEGLPAMHHAQPLMYDWDGDGLEDLLLAGDSYADERIARAVVWCRNTGKAGAPEFESHETLLGLYTSRKEHQANALVRTEMVGGNACRNLGSDLRIAMGDLNGDGRDDLVVGDSCHLTILRESVVAKSESIQAAMQGLEEATALFDDDFEKGWEAQEKALESLHAAYVAETDMPKGELPVAKGAIWVLERK